MEFLHVHVSLLLLCGARFSGGSAVAAATPPAGDVIELPAYTVTDSRELAPPARWSCARIEGFEVLSNASERATRDILQHFRRFSQALDVVWPGIKRPAAVLVLCGLRAFACGGAATVSIVTT